MSNKGGNYESINRVRKPVIGMLANSIRVRCAHVLCWGQMKAENHLISNLGKFSTCMSKVKFNTRNFSLAIGQWPML